MNKYGELAMRMVRDFDPGRWEAIEFLSRESYFSDLGSQIQSRVADLSFQLEGQGLPGEPYLEKVGRLNMAVKQAEEIVLKEMVYDLLPPDEGDEEDLPIAETTAVINEMNAAMSLLHEE